MTITVDDEVARWARIWAARENSSVSYLVGELLRERMHAEQSYEQAMSSFFSRQPVAFQKPKGRYPTRAELHER